MARGANGGAAERFLELWCEIADLERAASILGWDQETQMPPNGHAARGKLQATLAGIRHSRLIASELTEAIDAAAQEAGPESVLAAQVREARRVVRRVSRVPESLARELAEAQTLGHEAWCRAREAADFALFEPVLAQLKGTARHRTLRWSPVPQVGLHLMAVAVRTLAIVHGGPSWSPLRPTRRNRPRAAGPGRRLPLSYSRRFARPP